MDSAYMAKHIVHKLERLAEYFCRKGCYEKTLECMTAKARLEYIWNQVYTDDKLEELILELSEFVGDKIQHKKEENKVLFYDGFGLDYRGLVQIYLKALVDNGYNIVYVTNATTQEEQPLVTKILGGKNNVIYYSNGQNLYNKVLWLDKIFREEKFDTAFFYTTPWDVSAAISFYKLEGQCKRFQINLTDHAFWVGVNSFNYCLEFRNYGAAISKYYRNINASKLIKLPYYPIINREIEFQGFPFTANKAKIIFSGGAIYKIEDRSKTFLRLVEYIVKKHSDTIFVYAGSGNSQGLEHLVMKYPGRVWHIDEREDLFKILEHSYLYLNTYPISGALMLQYATVANCIPITLRRSWDEDACGMLLREDELGEMFTDFDDACTEIDKLITDEKYYKVKKNELKNQVISERMFCERLRDIIDNPEFYQIGEINAVDTELFRKQYNANIALKDIANTVLIKEYIHIAIYLPELLVIRVINKLIRMIKNK